MFDRNGNVEIYNNFFSYSHLTKDDGCAVQLLYCSGAHVHHNEFEDIGRGAIDVPWIIRCLSDHENYPKAICRHPADTALPMARRSTTVAGIIYNLTDGVAHICRGPSCENEFVAVPL